MSQFLFCRVAGSCAGSNFSCGQRVCNSGIQSAKLLLSISPLNALKKAPVPRETTGTCPLEELGSCQGESQQVPSRGCCGNRVALSSLRCLLFLQSSQQPPVHMFLGVMIPFSPCSFSCQGKPHSVLRLFRVTEVEGSCTARQHESP